MWDKKESILKIFDSLLWSLSLNNLFFCAKSCFLPLCFRSSPGMFFFFLAFNWPCTILPFLKFIGDVLSLHWEMQKVLVEWEFFFMVYSCKLSYLGQSQTSCGKGEKEAETIFACSTLEVASLKSFGLSPGAADFFP